MNEWSLQQSNTEISCRFHTIKLTVNHCKQTVMLPSATLLHLQPITAAF